MPPYAATARVSPSSRKQVAGLHALAEQAAAATQLLKLLANENRLLILCFMMVRGEMTVGELVAAVKLSQSAISQHLAQLRKAGIVAFRRDAQMLYYRVADRRASRVFEVLKEIYCKDIK